MLVSALADRAQRPAHGQGRASSRSPSRCGPPGCATTSATPASACAIASSATSSRRPGPQPRAVSVGRRAGGRRAGRGPGATTAPGRPRWPARPRWSPRPAIGGRRRRARRRRTGRRRPPWPASSSSARLGGQAVAGPAGELAGRLVGPPGLADQVQGLLGLGPGQPHPRRPGRGPASPASTAAPAPAATGTADQVEQGAGPAATSPITPDQAARSTPDHWPVVPGLVAGRPGWVVVGLAGRGDHGGRWPTALVSVVVGAAGRRRCPAAGHAQVAGTRSGAPRPGVGSNGTQPYWPR